MDMKGSNPTTSYLMKGRTTGDGRASNVASGKGGLIAAGQTMGDRDAGTKAFKLTKRSLNGGRKM